MGFEELLRKKLGPMRDLVSRASRPDPPVSDPGALAYRRAVGLEVRVRPEETWSEVEVGRAGTPASARVRLNLEDAARIAGLTRWTTADELARLHGLRPVDLWRFVERDLLFFSTALPDVHLTGEAGVLARLPAGAPVRRRASMWPTPAVETAIEIAPMPFMPRAADLAGAELVGFRFASLERGFEVLGVTITGTKKTGLVLRALLPLLDGTRSEATLLAELPSEVRACGKRMLELLDRMTVLEPAVGGQPPPSTLLRAPRSPQVTWLGHAAVLFQASGKNILVDPLFFSKSEPDERWLSSPKLDPRSLPPLDAVLITHGDNDHLNAASLAQLSPAVPIFIPRIGDRPPAYQVDMPRMLRLLGFEDVRELDPWGAAAIGGVEVTACPFEGESWDLDLAQATYLVEAEGASAFFAADSQRMDETYHRLAARSRRIDLAFMGVSGSAESYVMPDGFGYGSFYADWVPRVRRNEWVAHCAGPRESAASVAILRPRFAFGYAAGGASFIRTEYSDTGDHQQLARLVEAALSDTRPVALPLGLPVAFDALAALSPL